MTARERLRDWIRDHGTAKDFAEEIGVHPAYLSQMLSGCRRGSLPILAKIEDETGIPIRGWLLSEHGASAKRRSAKPKRANVGGVQSGI